MPFNKKLNEFQERLFDIFIYISYFVIIFSILGISSISPELLNTFDYYVKIYVCLFIIWRFNPFKNETVFTSLDRKVAFNAGTFILATTTLNVYLEDIQNYMKHIL